MQLGEQPLISAICPTADRHWFVERSIECFRRQTWVRRELVILDSGIVPVPQRPIPGVRYLRCEPAKIGALRNRAIEQSRGTIIVHTDDDDWYHQNRFAEQYELLTAHDADVVGYRSMVFYRKHHDLFYLYNGRVDYALGASLMYKRSTWEKRRFRDIPGKTEDNDFITGRYLVAANGHRPVRMIAVQHGFNTCPQNFQETSRDFRTNWRMIRLPHETRALQKLLESSDVC